jgi:hypothetical protein
MLNEQSDQWWSKQTADGAYHVEVRLACCRITDYDSAEPTADVSEQQQQQQHQQQHSQHIKVSLQALSLLTAMIAPSRIMHCSVVVHHASYRAASDEILGIYQSTACCHMQYHV